MQKRSTSSDAPKNLHLGEGLAEQDSMIGASFKSPGLLDRLRLGLPGILMRNLSPQRRKTHMRLALQFGHLDRLAAVRGLKDPYGDATALFFAIDYLITTGCLDRLSDLSALARLSPRYAQQIWSALCLWQNGEQTQALAALSRLRNDERLSGYQRDSAATWAAWCQLPPLSDQQGPPPQIIQFWDTPDLPPDVVAEIARWQNPAGHLLVDDNAAERFISDSFGQTEARLFRAAPHPAIRSDVWRLCWLARHGGLYIDADARQRPGFAAVHGLMGRETLLWFRTRNAATVLNNAVLAAPPGAPLILAALETAWRNLVAPQHLHVFAIAGPSLLTRTMLELHSKGTLGPVATVNDGWVAKNVMTQIDASYKRDGRSWHLWQQTRG